MKRQQETGSHTGLEAQIRHTLLSRSESIQVTSADTERMERSVHRKIEEASVMRKWNTGKMIVVVAAVCVLGSITAVAAGRINQINSQSSHVNNFTYGQLGAMEKRLGFVTKAPEAFSNGYRFSTGVPVESSGMDQEGNVVGKGEDFSLDYKKDGQPDVYLTVENTTMYQGQGHPDQVFEHNGVSVAFNIDRYRFVPEDYQVSAEEQAEMDAGKLVISYGSEEVTNQVYQGVSWEQNGICYYMNSFDSSLTAEEMVQMAGEIIDSK